MHCRIEVTIGSWPSLPLFNDALVASHHRLLEKYRMGALIVPDDIEPRRELRVEQQDFSERKAKAIHVSRQSGLLARLVRSRSYWMKMIPSESHSILNSMASDLPEALAPMYRFIRHDISHSCDALAIPGSCTFRILGPPFADLY